MRIVFVGASGHGKVCSEIAELVGYDEIIFLDDNRELFFCASRPVVGTKDDFLQYINKHTFFFVSIGNLYQRQGIQEKIEKNGGAMAVLIHPNSVISNDVKIGAGTVVAAGTVINPGTTIGRGCIVNTCSSIDHDCIIGDYSHISVGTHVCGSVKMGVREWVGAGAVISNNINLCDDCTIGAGAVVVKSITSPGTYLGVPAQKMDR